MGSLIKMFSKSENFAQLSKVTGIKGSGIVIARVNNVDYSVRNATKETVKIGDTVLLNRSAQGRFFIVGVTEGLGSQNNIEEVYRNG